MGAAERARALSGRRFLSSFNHKAACCHGCKCCSGWLPNEHGPSLGDVFCLPSIIKRPAATVVSAAVKVTFFFCCSHAGQKLLWKQLCEEQTFTSWKPGRGFYLIA